MELLGGGVLEQVPHSTGLNDAHDGVVNVPGRQRHNVGVARCGTDLAGGLDPVHDGHAQVHEHDIGLDTAHHVDRLTAVTGLSDDDVVLAGPQERLDGRARQWVVVDEDDDLAVNAPLGDLRGTGNTDGVTSQVIAVHGDVQGADRDLGGGLCLPRLLGPLRPFSRGDGERLDESVRKWCSPTGDPEDDDVLRAVVALQNLVRDAEQGAGYIGRSEDLLALDRCARGA